MNEQFDQLRNETSLLQLRIQKTTSLNGLLFISFVVMLFRAREAGLLARQSVDDIIFEMSKINPLSTGDAGC